MSTFGDMASRIADELAREDLTSQIQLAILRAIRVHERRRWYFNEMSFSFATVSGQEFYDSNTDQNIGFIKTVDTCKLIVGNNRYPITQRTWQYIDQISITTTTYGQPQDFALYGYNSYVGDSSGGAPNGQQIRFYPIPDLSSYTVTITGLVDILQNPGLATDPYGWPGNTISNVWSLDAEDLICSRAKWDVCKNYLKDMDAATAAKAEETDALQSLLRISAMRISSGSVMPSPF